SELLNNSDIRAFIDDRNEKIGKKIRESELKKIPFMLIVGEKEAENREISVRQRSEGDKGSMSIESFAKLVSEAIEQELSATV
ncbi:MAG: His/Gly/Thr/Pro-type tRNA ligase C-terminal domain-containing protein, partial [Fluviicola sp.]